jgi:DNA-binding CsgD family transcriptional regulator
MREGVNAARVIGRAKELARIETFLVSAGLTPSALVLEGEPGIGKTMLWRKGVESARRRGYRVLVTRPGTAESDLSFAALGDLLAGFEDEIGALPEPQRRALRVAMLLEDPKGLPPDPRAIGVAVGGLFRALAREGPVLVAVDDAHWADRSSAAAIIFAFRRREGAPISLLASRRPEVTGGFEQLEPIDVVSIRPLSDEAIVQLLFENSAGRLRRPMLTRLAGAAGGNPFFAVELARAMLDEGDSSGASDRLSVPGSLAQLLRRRLAPLPGPTQTSLLLVAAASQPSNELLRAAGAVGLADAFDAGVLEEQSDRVRFSHPLLAAHVLAEAEPGAVASAHRALAEVVVDTEQRARHLAASTPLPDREVAETLDGAAREARARGAPEAAAAFAEEAVRATPGNDRAALFQRLLAAAEHVNDAGDALRATRLAEEAVRISASGEERASALYYLATVRPDSGTGATIKTLEAALAEEGVDPATRAAVIVPIVHLRLSNGADPGETAELAREGLDLATQTHNTGLQALALAAVGEAEFHFGHGVPAELMERAIELELRSPYLELDFRPRAIYGYQLLRTHRLDEARQLFEELEALGRERSDPSVAFILCYLGNIAVRQSDYARAANVAEEALGIARQSGRTSVQCFALTLRLSVAADCGELELGRALLAEILALIEITDDRQSRAMAVGRGASLELSVGAPEAAYALLAPELERVCGRPFDPNNEAFMTSGLIDAAVELGRIDEAQMLLERLETRMTRDDPRTSVIAMRAHGIIASARSDHEQAVSLLRDSLDRMEGFDSPLLKARTLLALGRAERRARQHGTARATLERAHALFVEVGAQEWAARAQEERARIAGRPAVTGKLTPTERRIAELVAEGRTNHEVANILFASPKTVEWNLSKIYKKLHVRSRAELAAKLAKR